MDKGLSKKKIEQIGNLPTLPEIATRLQQIVNDPTTSAIDAANLIGRDPGLTSKVLRLANSAFYGIPRTITTVQNAVVILGLKVVNTLVLSISVVQLFPSDRENKYFDRKSYWLHCLACAVIAKLLALKVRKFNLFDPEECFCAGLLHDIGRMVLDQYLHEEFLAVLEDAHKREVPLLESELKIMGFSHADVGDWLTAGWDLPQDIRAPIIHHHDPESSEQAKEITVLIQWADRICYDLGHFVPGFEKPPPLLEDSLKLLGLGSDDLDSVKRAAPEEIEKLRSAFIFP